MTEDEQQKKEIIRMALRALSSINKNIRNLKKSLFHKDEVYVKKACAELAFLDNFIDLHLEQITIHTLKEFRKTQAGNDEEMA